MITRKYLCGSFLMMVSIVFILHPTAFAGYTSAQKKIMALRAARMDAIRNLTETIYGTRVDSDTLVEDLVVSSDKIRTRMEACIKGATEVSHKFNDDGTAEVKMEIEVGRVTDILGTSIEYDGKVFTATGFGAPPHDIPSHKPSSRVGPVDNNAQDRYIIRATGFGAAPDSPDISDAQKRAMGYRAAEVDARRTLLEIAKGVRVTSDTYIVDMVTKSDVIKSKVEGYLKNAVVVDRRESDGIYEVDMELDLTSLVDFMRQSL